MTGCIYVLADSCWHFLPESFSFNLQFFLESKIVLCELTQREIQIHKYQKCTQIIIILVIIRVVLIFHSMGEVFVALVIFNNFFLQHQCSIASFSLHESNQAAVMQYI